MADVDVVRLANPVGGEDLVLHAVILARVRRFD